MLKLSLICPESSCNETINGDMEHIINKIRFAFSSALLALMVIFLIVFPKGGVKIGGILLPSVICFCYYCGVCDNSQYDIR